MLTGSANVLLLPALADSLARRMEVVHLWPLSGCEMAGHAQTNRADLLFNGPLQDFTPPPCDRATLADALLQGGYPEAVASTSASLLTWLLDMTADSLNGLPGHVVETHVAAELLKHLGSASRA